MVGAFFTSWALWAKMTFILSLAIVTVFGIGYSKLAWQNRILRRHQAADEARKQKIAELRRSGQLIETRKSHDVPFGIRAVQSGIRIDGIWVSNPSTPVSMPSLTRLPLPRKASSDFSTSIINAVSDLESQTATTSSGRGQLLSRAGEPSNKPTGQEGPPQELQNFRTLHKPRNPSHLRFGGYGEVQCDEETLGHLEGYQSIKDKLLSKDGYASSGAMADNECSSPSSYGGSISNNNTGSQNNQRLSLPQWSTGRSSLMPPPSQATRSSFPQSSKGDYFSIPIESPDDEASGVYLTPPEFPVVGALSSMSANTRDIADMTLAGPSEATHLIDTPQPSRAQSPFIPGELHRNKAVRKVNSGFEVLPAGTFGINPSPPDMKGKGVDRASRWSIDEGKRSTNKLQKKNRTSMSSRRASSATDHV